MIRTMSRRNTPMVPLSGGGVGLLEKRESAFSWLGLSDTAAGNGDFGLGASSTLLMDDDAAVHNNHAEDPGASTMALTDSAGLIMDLPRTIAQNVGIDDHVHACLCGIGGADLNRHTLTATETINIGMPVYVPSHNAVSTANATPLGADYTRCYPIGLSNSNATAAGSCEILTEGSVFLADWTLVIGTPTLTVGVWYYLGETAGTLTTTPITTDNSVSIRVGRALTTTKFDIEITEPVIL